MKMKLKRDTVGIGFNDFIGMIHLLEDKKFLEIRQQQYTEEFLKKFADNYFLHIHKNIYEPDGEYN
jgi:hypothetical protein